jgi:hypothetical protein
MKLNVQSEVCCEECGEVVHNHFDCPVCKKNYVATDAYHDLYFDKPVEFGCRECGTRFILREGETDICGGEYDLEVTAEMISKFKALDADFKLMSRILDVPEREVCSRIEHLVEERAGLKSEIVAHNNTLMPLDFPESVTELFKIKENLATALKKSMMIPSDGLLNSFQRKESKNELGA